MNDEDDYPLGNVMLAIRDELGAVDPSLIGKGDRNKIAWYRGRRFLAANGRIPPSYCWYPGNITPGDPFKGDLGQYTSVATGLEIAEVHCWGATDAISWTLRHNLIAAAKKLRGADAAYLGDTFYDGNDQGFGSGYVTRLHFKIPVISVTLAVVTITAVDETGFIVLNETATQGC